MGTEAADPADEDLADALLLSWTDLLGGSLWHPARLEDLLELPWRVMPLLHAVQSGFESRGEPWQWWQRGDARVALRAHQYAATLAGTPQTAARRGYDPAGDPKAAPFDWARPPNLSRTCPRCDDLAAGRTTEVP